MVSEETAKRIADSLERLVKALESMGLAPAKTPSRENCGGRSAQ